MNSESKFVDHKIRSFSAKDGRVFNYDPVRPQSQLSSLSNHLQTKATQRIKLFHLVSNTYHPFQFDNQTHLHYQSQLEHIKHKHQDDF